MCFLSVSNLLRQWSGFSSVIEILSSNVGRQLSKLVASLNFWQALFGTFDCENFLTRGFAFKFSRQMFIFSDADTVSSVASGRFARLVLTRSFETMKHSWRQTSRTRTERVRQMFQQFNRNKSKTTEPEASPKDLLIESDEFHPLAGAKLLHLLSHVYRLTRQGQLKSSEPRSKL